MAQKRSKADLRAARQKRIIENLRKKENWMKWGLIGALILIILLILFLGYVTDWGAGVKKSTSPSTTDTSKNSIEQTPTSAQNGGGGSGGSPAPLPPISGGQSSHIERTTTNNTTTPPVNNTTTQHPTALLLAEVNLGQNINEVIDLASQLGIGVSCTDVLIVKECTFTAGGQTITTKSVGGIVTSILG